MHNTYTIFIITVFGTDVSLSFCSDKSEAAYHQNQHKNTSQTSLHGAYCGPRNNCGPGGRKQHP